MMKDPAFFKMAHICGVACFTDASQQPGLQTNSGETSAGSVGKTPKLSGLMQTAQSLVVWSFLGLFKILNFVQICS